MPLTWPRSSTFNLNQTSSQWYYWPPVVRYILNVRDKKKLTEELILLLPEEQRISPQSARIAWWFNLRPRGGMRLTTLGYMTFCDQLDLEKYEYSITDPKQFNQQLILALDRKLQMPYYIVVAKGIPKKIIFFGSKEAVLVNLYGNLEKFLDNYN